MTPANALAWFAQVAVIVAACAGLPRLVGLRAPSVQHVFWRVLLAVCLLLPVAQPRLPDEMVFVPAPAAAATAPARTAPPAAPAPPRTAVDWMTLAAIVMAAGTACRLAWIGAGLVRLRRLRRGAVEQVVGFDDLRQMIGAGGVPIFWSSDTTHPITFGALAPVILLPAGLKSADPAAQRAVVAHELHHVKRGDWLWTVVEEIVRAAFWFHPAMWWLISRVQLARETVVDELSILTTNARRAYLDTLLAFADDTGLQSSTAFSARRHLFHRVMLLSKEGSMSSTRIAIGSSVLAAALVAGTWEAVSAFPLHGGTAATGQAAAQKPPRDPRDPAPDHQQAVEYWEQAYRDLSLTPEMRLDVVRKGIAAEDRALAINPDYQSALVYKNILLRMQANLTTDRAEQDRLIAEANELRHKAMTLGVPPPPPPASDEASVRMMPPPPPPPPPPGGQTTGVVQMVFVPSPPLSPEFAQSMRALDPVRIGGGIMPPVKIRDVKPVYPPLARQAGVQGVVIIEALIDSEGAVAEARVLRSIPLLDEAALNAVREWHFAPTILDGSPRAVIMTVTVSFSVQ
jgi:protein TonB